MPPLPERCDNHCIVRGRLRIDATFVPRRSPGCRVEYHPDGSLRRYAAYSRGACLACLDLAEDGSSATFRQGIAGEVYAHGVIEPIGPFAGSAPPRSTTEALEEWVRWHVATISALGAAGAATA